MDFEHSEKVRTLQERVEAFMATTFIPTRRSSSRRSMTATAGSRSRSSTS
jgi:hypothetical protein